MRRCTRRPRIELVVGGLAVACLALPAGAATEAAWGAVSAATPGPSLLPGLRLDVFASAPAAGTTGASLDPDDHRRYVLPVVLSALVPGAGEIATGHFWRGLPLVALDVATWLVHADYQKQGRDARDRYEAFADAHWGYDRWQQVLRTYYDDPAYPHYDWWDSTAAFNCTCPYVAKEADRQHYYENIGKYIFYYGGWEDWEYPQGVPDSVAKATADSKHLRRQYGDMRIESNDAFDHGTQMLYVAMATRLLSVVQVTWLVRGDLQQPQRLEVRPLQSRSAAAGLELRYHY